MTPASGLSCIVVAALVIVVTVDNRVYAKRGCSAFGHSCFGGHGKRFDPRALGNALTESESLPLYSGIRANEIPQLTDEFIVDAAEQKMQGRQERPSSTGSPRNAQQLDPYALSFLVNQWLASHRRLHQKDFMVNND